MVSLLTSAVLYQRLTSLLSTSPSRCLRLLSEAAGTEASKHTHTRGPGAYLGGVLGAEPTSAAAALMATSFLYRVRAGTGGIINSGLPTSAAVCCAYLHPTDTRVARMHSPQQLNPLEQSAMQNVRLRTRFGHSTSTVTSRFGIKCRQQAAAAARSELSLWGRQSEPLLGRGGSDTHRCRNSSRPAAAAVTTSSGRPRCRSKSASRVSRTILTSSTADLQHHVPMRGGQVSCLVCDQQGLAPPRAGDERVIASVSRRPHPIRA